MHSNRTNTLVALALITAIAAFHLLTIRPGHYWGDDFALYVLHARNLAEGIPYADTGYIYNPSYASLSPRTYPPVYPLILAPVIRWAGMNLEAMKTETALFFPAALFVIFLLFRNELRFRDMTALLAVLGFSPFLWTFKDEIRSDIPFLFFLYLSFLGVRIAGEAGSSGRRWAGTLLAGAAACLACGTRTLGILLVPSFFASDMVVRKRPTVLATAVTLMCAAWVMLQSFLVGRDASYFDQYAGWTPRVLLDNAVYVASLAYFWANGYSKAAAAILFLAVCALAAVGYVARVRRRVTGLEVFLPLYVAVVVSWPAVQGLRFLVPILPLFLFYSFVGIETVPWPGRMRTERRVFIALMTAVGLSFAARYSTLEFGTQTTGIHTKNAADFFRFIRERTAPDDVFVFAKPRALALFTGRRAAACHEPRDGQELWAYVQNIRASYVALGPLDDEPLRRLVDRNGDRFDAAYSNAEFLVYRIKEPAAAN